MYSPMKTHLQPANHPELWAGFECTVNRVGDRYLDQLELSGHAHRESDLELLRDLGVKAVRYPVGWERTARDPAQEGDWSWSDRRLNKIRELGIMPIVGLLHHGSGPRHTNLLDPKFPELLAQYAAKVAERYPWVDAYTPVNEPLTTARFSCLYGHWYPHEKNDAAFFRALINQCRATVLAMREIRKINPRARLIQTEDLGKTHSTAQLEYQAEFENERRWLSLDLLCGRVDKDHPLREYLNKFGVTDDDLAWFRSNRCPPDIMGFNYYLSSERFIDHRVEEYTGCAIGGNGREPYVDIEAARILKDGIDGAGGLLREAWQRYGLPLAITELHNGCTREEQARWFVEQYESASALLSEGIDLRAITAWALLGSFYWNTLVTREGNYEPGVYDLRADRPLPTIMVKVLRELAEGRIPDEPFLKSPGWWQKSSRHIYGVCYSPRIEKIEAPSASLRDKKAPPILIAGRGTLGNAFARICNERGLDYQLLSRAQMDIADVQSVNAAVNRWHPWAIVNAAGYARVDDAELESEQCWRENTNGPAVLAAICENRGIKLLSFSSDLVFDGNKSSPYLESDPVRPLNVYGRSKAEAERAVLMLSPSALIVRTSAFFGPWDEANFITATLNALARGHEVTTVSDYVISPTYVPDLVHTSLDLLINGAQGVWHLANRGAITWSELAMTAARMGGITTARLSHSRNCQWISTAVRPRYSVLGSERANFMPSLEDALTRYFAHADLQWRKSAPIVDTDMESGLAA